MSAPLRRLGRSGLETPPLILGGNVFGWTIGEAESFAVLDAFVGAGGRMIDTADIYSHWVPGHHGGESETIIGAWLERRGRRDDVQVTTKVGNGEGGLAPDAIRRSCDESLKRLRSDHIDLYELHRDHQQWPLAETLGVLDGLVRAGKVRAIGCSNFTAGRLAEALDISERDGLARFEVLQPFYNLMRRHEYEGSLADLCVEREVAATPYYGLAAGYLTGKYRTDADVETAGRGADTVRPFHEGRGPRVLAALDDVAAETGTSPAVVALAWLSHRPGVAAPLASATSPEQLHQLLPAMTLALSTDQVARLDAGSARA